MDRARNTSSVTVAWRNLNLPVPAIHVVAGVVRDRDGRILLTQRPPGKHLAGLWEFPGGKRESGESPEAALRRELHEEIGIDACGLRRLICFPWHYAEKSIFLDVYNVLEYDGEPHGREGQGLRWEIARDLAGIPMPAADVSIITALQLPDQYIITPEPSGDIRSFLHGVEVVLRTGADLIQLRSKHLDRHSLHALAKEVQSLAHAASGRLLLNGHVDIVRDLKLDGVHLNSTDLMSCAARPLERPYLVGASCHDEVELVHAVAIDVDFVVLGPVMPTTSHADAHVLGWTDFAKLCNDFPLPVYALGGMTIEDLPKAIDARAQGVAGISGFWR